VSNDQNHEEHEDREDLKDLKDLEAHERRRVDDLLAPRFRMRLPSPLSPQTELVMTQTIGCVIAVHRVLGPGYLESIYREAVYIELHSRNLAFEAERPVTVRYRGTEIAGQRVDLIVEGQVIVEIKSVVRLGHVHEAQLLSYLRTTGLRAGLLVNFHVPSLRQGLRRIVL